MRRRKDHLCQIHIHTRSCPGRPFLHPGFHQGTERRTPGDDINKKRANAIKILSRFLYKEQEKMDLRLHSSTPASCTTQSHATVSSSSQFQQAKKRQCADWNIFTANVEEESM